MFSEEFEKEIFSTYGGEAPSDVPEGLVLWDPSVRVIAWTDANILYTYSFDDREESYSVTCREFFSKNEEGDISFTYLPLEFLS